MIKERIKKKELQKFNTAFVLKGVWGGGRREEIGQFTFNLVS